MCRFREEVERRAVGQLHLAAPPRREQLGPADAEFAVQGGDEVDGPAA